MCGRYSIESERARTHVKLNELDFFPDYFQGAYFASYNIAPTTMAPVMRRKKELELMHWWLIPNYEKEFKAGKWSMFNKKSEELDKPYWQRLLKGQRCVVPMDGFFEWKKLTPKDKIPYFIRPADDSYFWVAGLYDNWVNKETGEVRSSFTILTMEPNEFMAEVHNRMPVFLDPQSESLEAWLSGDLQNPKDLITTFPSERMERYEVPSEVGNTRNNYKELTMPVKIDKNNLF